MKVGVIDYGVGNIGSVSRAIEAVRGIPLLIDRPTDMKNANCLILPGVGNFADCVRQLERGGWISALKDQVFGYNRPLLGICVGMQLLADMSEEGSDGLRLVPGLGFIPGEVVHLRSLGCKSLVPHVGWNSVSIDMPSDCLFSGIPHGTDFYFVHSYVFKARNQLNVIASGNYDVPFTVAIKSGCVWGTQFHPEKSSRAGFRVLQNFIEASRC